MSTPIITLKRLHTEGRLSIGDILTHSTIGDCELICVTNEGRLHVKTPGGDYQLWTLDLPADCRVVPVNSGV